MICENCGKEFFEDWRKDSAQRKKPLRFCCRSCSSSKGHRVHIEEFFCLNCGKSLGTGYRAKTNTYCDNTCQQQYQQKNLLNTWITTGVMNKFTGGSWGNTPAAKYVRDFLMKRQNGKCDICHAEAIHNKKPLKFILDHVDGDCTNNTPDNLRFICPNCDSQTDTFKARNKGRGRKSKGFRVPSSLLNTSD